MMTLKILVDIERPIQLLLNNDFIYNSSWIDIDLTTFFLSTFPFHGVNFREIEIKFTNFYSIFIKILFKFEPKPLEISSFLDGFVFAMVAVNFFTFFKVFTLLFLFSDEKQNFDVMPRK